MNSSPILSPRCRRLYAVIAIVLLILGVGAATAAETASPPAVATPSQRLHQRFAASVEGWRKAAPKLSDKQPQEPQAAHEPQLLRELRVVVAPTAVPLLRVQRRIDGHTLIVSAGWLALLDELLQAQAAYAMAPGAGERCPHDYLQSVLAVVRDNRDRASKETPQPLQAWPRFASWLASDDTRAECRRIKPSVLRSATVEAQVIEGADTAALWLLTRQAARLAALPVPKPSTPAASGANAAPAATTDDAALAVRVAFATPAVSAQTAPADAAVAPSPAASSPDQLAQHALDGYGLKLPAALVWLRDDAPELFR